MEQKHHTHIADEEILLFLDGETSPSGFARIREHLDSCWTCRTRKTKLESTVSEFVETYHADMSATIPPAGTSLRAQLAAAAMRESARIEPRASARGLWLSASSNHPAHRLAWASAAMVILTATAVFVISPFRNQTAITPIAALTPGATRPMSREAVCAAPDRAGPPPVSAAVAREVFSRYSIRDPRPRSYEVDYLIPPSLGGSEDPKNLWPQPYTRGVWSAHVKDALEDRLHAMVCDGTLDLAMAQRDLARDWIAAYKKYFQTEKPRLDHVAFVKDRPWE